MVRSYEVRILFYDLSVITPGCIYIFCHLDGLENIKRDVRLMAALCDNLLLLVHDSSCIYRASYDPPHFVIVPVFCLLRYLFPEHFQPVDLRAVNPLEV